MKKLFKCEEFWAMIIGVIGSLLFAFGVNDVTGGQVIGITGAIVTIIGYILGRCYVRGKECEGGNGQ